MSYILILFTYWGTANVTVIPGQYYPQEACQAAGEATKKLTDKFICIPAPNGRR